MKSVCVMLALLFGAPATGLQVVQAERMPACSSVERHIGAKEFESVMNTVAEGWNRGDSQLAASCFAEAAIFSGPPSPAHRGRKDLFEWFGGTKGRPLRMYMSWHHLLFDAGQQIGVGEFTFRYKIQTHGLVIVKIANGLIINWREYEIESPLAWDQFVGENRF